MIDCKECIQIGEGWTKLSLHMIGVLDKKSVEEANRKRSICDNCPSLVKSKTQFLQCKECKCYYPMLCYASTKSCPLNKW